jgi:hypothetical protein
MTEAKWRHIDTVTEEMYGKGSWSWHARVCSACANPHKIKFASFLAVSASYPPVDGQVYGPIPDAPKPPPTLRRFTAIECGVPVSGVLVEGCNSARTYRWSDSVVRVVNTGAELSKLTDIVWLD